MFTLLGLSDPKYREGRMDSKIAANEVIIAMKAKLKYKKDEYFRQSREAGIKAQECVDWLDVLDNEIRQQERFSSE